MARKFKVGDIVKANKLANKRYSITREGWTGEVTKLGLETDTISVVGTHDDRSFSVLDPGCFDLVESKTGSINYDIY